MVMIRGLKKRPRSDALANEVRVAANPVGRWIYMGLLGFFAIAVLNYLFGDLFIMRADGLVLKDQSVIATTFVARIEQVDVREGQQVERGQVLLRIQSTEMLERLADLSARRARLAADNVEFTIRAKKREDEASRVVGKFDQMALAGLTTASSYDSALTANYNAQQDRVKLATQKKTLDKELATLHAARDGAEDALENLRLHYAEGVVRAPVTGSIGASVPSIGNVYRTGDPILTIHSGEPYVLAYLPHRYLFSIRANQNVTVSDGRNSVGGVITEILPITDALAKEFQSTFKPRDRSQLAKIRLLEASPFPLQEKVAISARYF